METIIVKLLSLFDGVMNVLTWGHWGWSQGNKSSRAYVKDVHIVKRK